MTTVITAATVTTVPRHRSLFRHTAFHHTAFHHTAHSDRLADDGHARNPRAPAHDPEDTRHP
ncbi:hypothetical protein [Streptosporangium sp. NPDC051022]|uniref:hypothetical protein n=1 Tax=Streptosporangium sp. NPDC051022 TaxID=3155752 RepID=UPI0034325EBB